MTRSAPRNAGPVADWSSAGSVLVAPPASRALGIGLLLLMAVLVWLDRDGYKDIDDEVPILDALYYATVSASTTGFGDIAPVSLQARTVNVLVVTPLRVPFLVVLVGSTLEVATRASRQRLRVARWQAGISDHTVVIDFGTTGRAAATRLISGGSTPLRSSWSPTMRERLPTPLPAIRRGGRRCNPPGHPARSSSRERTLHRRRAAGRRHGVLATLTARQLDKTATIAAAVRGLENADVLRDGGADAVILTAAAAGRQLAHGLRSPTVGAAVRAAARPRRRTGPDRA